MTTHSYKFPPLHGNYYVWLFFVKTQKPTQADAGDQPAVIFHRRNNKPWVTILTAEDLLAIMACGK